MGTLFHNISNTKYNCQQYACMYFTSNSFTSILYKSVFFISETMNKEKFENYLRKKNLSKQTVKMYSTSVKRYFDYYTNMDKNSLLNYKEHCETHYKPSAANVQINSLNHYLEFIGKGNLKLKLVRTQQKHFLENFISQEDYQYFKNKLRANGQMKWYFTVWFLAATGARISEALQVKVEHLKAGHIDLRSKGGKIRRIYIPRKLADSALDWLKTQQIETGFVFLNRSGHQITREGICKGLRKYAVFYGIPPEVVYPHSFRHRFAKNFLDKYKDIALLADLMGHESIETTRIYLRMTAGEQYSIVNKVVTW